MRSAVRPSPQCLAVAITMTTNIRSRGRPNAHIMARNATILGTHFSLLSFGVQMLESLQAEQPVVISLVLISGYKGTMFL